jgi:carbon monoxide dehydrogenase subunit G
MSSFSVKIQINAKPDDVWKALSDIGNIYVWNPGVKNSHLTSDVTEGIGTARYCDLGSSNYLDESVVKWESNRALTMRVTGTNLPFKSIDIRFTLREEKGGTEVEVSPVYELKFGVIGKALDALYVKKSYEKGMKNLLLGLKNHVEGIEVNGIP